MLFQVSWPAGIVGDSGKGLTIRYNPLHLPWEAKSNEGLLQFDHTYGGEKVRKVLSGTEGGHERLYLGGVEYVDGALEACYHGEGRVLLTGEGPRWQYRIADHLGNLAVLFEDRDGDGTITDEEDTSDPAVLEVLQRHFYYPFGMAMEGGWAMQAEHPNRYRYNGKELEGDLGLGWYFYGARMCDPAIGRFTGVDPLGTKYPSISPYAFSANNPIYYVDPDGREPVPSYYRLNPRFTLKPTQWYSTAGIYDSKTFNAAATYSTQHLRADAFQTVYQRNAYYGWAQSQADAKGYNSKWFGAAELVTGLNAVGATGTPNLWVIKDNTEDFLKGGNKFLFTYNMNNAKDLLADGKLSGGFTDANGVKQSFEGLTGMALDNKMVEFEQSKVQAYINSYNGNDLNSIIDNINDLFTGNIAKALGPGAVNDVMKDTFNGGKSFNFKSYEDRVKLGQELIKKAHNE